MKTCNNRSTIHRARRHHGRATPPRLMASIIGTLAWFSLLAGIGGSAWYSLTTTLDQMTAIDCRAGIQRACEALPR